MYDRAIFAVQLIIGALMVIGGLIAVAIIYLAKWWKG